MASKGGEETAPLELFFNEAAKFFGLDDIGACCYRPTIPQRAKPFHPNQFKLPPSKASVVAATAAAEAEPAAPSVAPPQLVAKEEQAAGDDDDDSFSFSSSARAFENYELPNENLDDISIEVLGQVYEAFEAQSRQLDLSLFMETTFYALCYVGSDGALEPCVSEDVMPRVMTATRPFHKMSKTEVRRQAVLLANDCKVTW